jgi:outer membrane protein assembly factor BamB
MPDVCAALPTFMHFLLSRSLFMLLLAARLAAQPASADWPGWRGPTADGQAAAGQKVPVKWSETENVVWRTPLRGRGHSSPTVVGNRIFLTTADLVRQEQVVLCLDRTTGKLLWETVAHRANLAIGNHRNSSPAASSVAWDGERLYVNFPNDRAIHTTALDASGTILWQRRVSDFVMHQGFGSSPVVHQSLVIVSADHRGGGKIAALDSRTGRVVWEHERPKIANYMSPAVITAAGRTQLVIAGCNLITSLDPLTGKRLWEIEGSTEECVVTPVTDGRRVFVSGGYPRSNTTAVEADGSGRIAWQNGLRVYVPSMLVRDSHVFAVMDAGQAVCWKSDTGEEVWRQKVDKDFYASPVMVGDHIYVTSLRGLTSVFEATPRQFKLIAQNKLGDEALASPSICGHRLYLRSAKTGDTPQDFLWCIGG